MARLKKGLSAGISGSIGNMIVGSWKGIPYVRAKPDTTNTKKKKQTTPAQDATRKRFALMAKFLGSMRPVLEIGYKHLAVQKTGTNCAISYAIKHAVAGAYPNFEIAYNRVLISQGGLSNATSPVAVSENNVIRFSWNNGPLVGKDSMADKAMLVVHHPQSIISMYTIGANRSAGYAELPLNEVFKGTSVHTWITFISADEKDLSNSIYTGEILVE
jgi:hypothetical protein